MVLPVELSFLCTYFPNRAVFWVQLHIEFLQLRAISSKPIHLCALHFVLNLFLFVLYLKLQLNVNFGGGVNLLLFLKTEVIYKLIFRIKSIETYLLLILEDFSK